MNSKKRALPKLIGTSVGLVFACAGQAWAQGSGLEEIIVTAQKRAQDLQDVGISVLAFSSDDISERAMTDITSVVQQTPSLGMIQFSPSVTIVSVRGVSQASYVDHLEGPVAVYLDDSYMAANGAISASMFDLERIEVLRGPQGTLFGRNATGGLVHFVTNKPTEETQGYLRLTAAEYSEFGAEGAIGGEISDGLLGRLSFVSNNSDGYIKDTTGPSAPEQKNYSFRGQLAKSFGEDSNVLLSLRYSRNPNEVADSYLAEAAAPDADGLGYVLGPDEDAWGTCPGCNIVGYTYPDLDRRERSTVGKGGFDRKMRGGSLTFTTTIGEIDLTSVTDYGKMSKEWLERTDPSPVPTLGFTTGQEFEQFSQEIRLSGNAGALDWIGGLFYLDIESDNFQRTFSDFGFDYLDDFQQETRSEAVFAQIDYAFDERWSVTVGGRYSFDQKTMAIRLTDLVTGDSLGVYDENTASSADRDFNGFSGRLALNFQASEDVLLYTSINRGFKGGNWSAPPFPPLDVPNLPHDSERLTSYEVGAKATFADGLARLNASAFYYDYADYQAYTLVGGIAASVLNRDAELKGLELEFSAAPVEGLTLELSYAYLDSKVEDITLPFGRVTDRDMPMSPKGTWNGLLRYEWPAFGGTLALQADAKYESEQYFTTFNADVDLVDSRVVANARASYSFETSDYGVDFTLFARNFTDELYSMYAADVSALGFVQRTIAPPRVYGAEVTVSFD